MSEVNYKQLFLECALARDEAGFLGSVPECITQLSAELAAKDAEVALLRAGLDAIVDRADNGDLGTSKVQDMRRIADGLREPSL